MEVTQGHRGVTEGRAGVRRWYQTGAHSGNSTSMVGCKDQQTGAHTGNSTRMVGCKNQLVHTPGTVQEWWAVKTNKLRTPMRYTNLACLLCYTSRVSSRSSHIIRQDR